MQSVSLPSALALPQAIRNLDSQEMSLRSSWQPLSQLTFLVWAQIQQSDMADLVLCHLHGLACFVLPFVFCCELHDYFGIMQTREGMFIVACLLKSKWLRLKGDLLSGSAQVSLRQHQSYF